VAGVRLIGMSGLDLQERLASDDVRLPLVLVTGYANIPLTVSAMQKGAVTLLEKPCSSRELRAAIEDALARDARLREKEVRQRALRERLSALTADEREVMQLMVAGWPNKQMAMHQDVSIRTIENRRKSVLQRMGVGSLPELVRLTLEIDATPEAAIPRREPNV
jgi:FixJ family two-component response regulator